MTEVDFIRGEAITAPGEQINELLIIRQGRATVMHPKGKIALASLEYGGMIGSEVFLRRLAGKKNSATVDTISKWEVTAASLVKCYCIALDEVVRNCSGSHGQKTFTLLQDMLAVQDQRRRQDFKKQRNWQLRQLESRRKEDVSILRTVVKAKQAEVHLPYCKLSSENKALTSSGPSRSCKYPISVLGSSGGWDFKGGASTEDKKSMLMKVDSNRRRVFNSQSESFYGQIPTLKQSSKEQTIPDEIKGLGVIARIRLHRSIEDKKYLLVPALTQTRANALVDSL